MSDIPSSIDAFTKAISPLVSKIGSTADTVFSWAVRQNYVYAWEDIAAAVILLLICASYLVFIRWGLGNDGDRSLDRIDEYDLEGVQFVGGILSCIFLVGSVLMIFCAVPRFVNPQYSALQDVVNSITPGN